MSNRRSVCKCWLCFVFSVYLSKLVLASIKSDLFLLKTCVPDKQYSYWKLRQAEHSRLSNTAWVESCPVNLVLICFQIICIKNNMSVYSDRCMGLLQKYFCHNSCNLWLLQSYFFRMFLYCLLIFLLPLLFHVSKKKDMKAHVHKSVQHTQVELLIIRGEVIDHLTCQTNPLK